MVEHSKKRPRRQGSGRPKERLAHLSSMNHSQAVYLAKQEINEALALPPAQGKTVLEPFKSAMRSQGAPFVIVEDTRVSDNMVELHALEADVWMCLEGEAWFKVGGELVDPVPVLKDGVANPNELRAKEVRGAERYVMKPGDWLWVPAGVPHQHGCDGVARLMVMKIPLI